MVQRVIIVMSNSQKEQPLFELAMEWGVPCCDISRKAVHWPVQWVITTIKPDFYNNFLKKYELIFKEDNSREFLMNLRLLHGEVGLLAFLFSRETEHHMNKWIEASNALTKIVRYSSQAVEPYQKLAKANAPFYIECKTAKIDIEKYRNLAQADLDAITEAAMRELKACLL